MSKKNKVSYFYDSEVGNYYYGSGHPMKPHRIRMAHNLVLHYELYKEMTVYRPIRASAEDMAAFHSPDFISFLQNVTPGNQDQASFKAQIKQFMENSDCPIFENVFEFSQISSGGTIGGAVTLNHSKADIAINWAGGLHHAKQAHASGFCYVNDIVLGILELLKYHARVLYVDIDVHHGDGVEEAFLTSPRCLTVSFHKFADKFFPGTGALNSIGVGAGQHYAVNVPLSDGMDDTSYHYLFRPIMDKIMSQFQPGAVVIQCGADSLAKDKLGMFNLSSEGHAACVRYFKQKGVPLLVLGGGGYRISNVASCWAYETGVCVGKEADMADGLPPSEYMEYYDPHFKLRGDSDPGLVNQNSPKFLELLLQRVLQNLSHVQPVNAGFYDRAPDALHADSLAAARGEMDDEMDTDGPGRGEGSGLRTGGGDAGGGVVQNWQPGSISPAVPT